MTVTSSSESSNKGSADAPLPIEQIIANAVAGIEPGMAATTLETYLRAFCEELVKAKTSGLVRKSCYDQVKVRLKELHLPNLPKKDWDIFLKDADATHAFNQGTDPAAATAPPNLTPVLSVLASAPVPPEVLTPAGWLLGSHGLAKVRNGQPDQKVCSMPLVITKLLVNDAEDTVAVGLAWKRNGDWKHHVTGRSEIAAKNRIIDLADYGLAVTTGNADPMIDYLADFEATNLHHLPQIQVRRQLGWADKSKSSFLWGNTLLRVHAQETSDECDDSADDDDPFSDTGPNHEPQSTPQQVFFQGADAGDDQIAEGFHPEGTFDEWAAAIGPALRYPKVKMVILAALAAPLLSIFSVNNFIVDLCGPSSKGKTITLRTAASVWGKPDEQAPDGVLASWNASRVWIERGAAVLHNMPLILDDTKVAKKKEDIPQVLYDIASGRGRGRGTTKGTERTLTWSTVLLTSGEAPATSFSQDGGTRARVLTLWGMPFDKADEETSKLVEALRTGVSLNFGHAGPRLIEYVLAHRDRWPRWQNWLRRVRACYVKKAQGNSVVMRLSDALAALTVTGLIAWKALGIESLRRSPVKSLWNVIASAAAEADRTEQALRHVVEWAVAHQDEFFGRRQDKQGQPHSGWAGRWDGDQLPGYIGPAGSPKEPWEFLGILPACLRKILKDAGYEYEPTVQGWKERGWLLVDKSDKTGLHHQATLEREKPRMIALTRTAITEVTGVTTAPTRPAEPVAEEAA